MTGYVDSSVLLRILLREPGKLAGIKNYDELISSELIYVECMRVLYRYRMTGVFTDEELGERVGQANTLLEEISIVPLTHLVLQRASLPTPTILSTLDAIHFVTAQLWQERQNKELTLLSHDKQLQAAAHAIGIKAIG